MRTALREKKAAMLSKSKGSGAGTPKSAKADPKSPAVKLKAAAKASAATPPASPATESTGGAAVDNAQLEELQEQLAAAAGRQRA